MDMAVVWRRQSLSMTGGEFRAADYNDKNNLLKKTMYIQHTDQHRVFIFFE